MTLLTNAEKAARYAHSESLRALKRAIGDLQAARDYAASCQDPAMRADAELAIERFVMELKC